MTEPCTVCGDDSTTDHHTSYDPETTVRVCHPCHWRIHHEDDFRDDLEPEQSRPNDYETGEKSSKSFRLPNWLIEEADDLADEYDDSRTDIVIAALAEYIADHAELDTDTAVIQTDDGYVPSTDERRAVYLQALDSSTDKLRLHERHLGTVAQNLQTVNKDGVETILQDLRREGYVALSGHPPDCDTKNLSKTWRVKPRAVDPNDWSYRERQRDSRRDIGPLLSHGMDTDDFAGQCLSHHPNADGTRCLKCDAELDPDEYGPNECTCGASLDEGEALCPACRMAADEVEA